MKWAELTHLLLKYRMLLDSTQEIVLFYDAKGCILDCNSRTKTELGYGDDILRTRVFDIFKNVFIYEQNQIRLNEKIGKLPCEAIAYRKNQTCFPVELMVSVDKSSKTIGICTAISLSEKKEAERQIKVLMGRMDDDNRNESEFIAKTAHELRTPLNGIIGFIGNLYDMDLKPNQLEAVNLIKKCSVNLSSLINDLMDCAQISDKKLPIVNKEFAFRDFVQHIVDFNIGSINEKGLKLQIYISNDIPDRLIGDELRLTQVLNNLFSNAVKFTAVGQISLEVIKVIQTDRFIELLFMVEDTGIGIDTKEKDKLFLSFFQVDGSITRKYGGTGLGLSICKYIVEAMNGTITVDSEKDKGSTFSFTVHLGIPRDAAQSNCAEAEGEALEALTEKSPKADNNQGSDISEIDYVSRRLKNISIGEKVDSTPAMQEEEIDIYDLLEKLTICIEMENWVKAEQLSCKLKNLIQRYRCLNSKDILRLLFAIRREDHDASMLLLTEIKDCIHCEL